MNLSYLLVVCKVIKSFHLKLNFRKGLSCYNLGLFFYIFIRILPGLLSTCKFLSSRSFLGCQFDNFNIYLLRLETFFDNHLFLPPGATKAEGPLSLASMQLPVFSWIGVFCRLHGYSMFLWPLKIRSKIFPKGSMQRREVQASLSGFRKNVLVPRNTKASIKRNGVITLPW